jgi:xanthine dehydrogenase accessory factor
MLTFFDKLNELLNSATPFVMVTVVDTSGSVPQDAGSKMLVTENGLFAGTVGGGKVEARAIKEAVSLLQSCQLTKFDGQSERSGEYKDENASGSSSSSQDEPGTNKGSNHFRNSNGNRGANGSLGSNSNGSLGSNGGQGAHGSLGSNDSQGTNSSLNASSSKQDSGASENEPCKGPARDGRRHNPASTKFFSWSLNTDIGMTCGGSVRMFMEAFNLSSWRIIIFGAGHLSCALIGILKQLDCQVVCYDTRVEWLAKLPESSNIRKIDVDSLPAQVKDLRAGDSVCLMSMGHSTDMPVLLEILKKNLEGSLNYLGVIGSAAKAARLRKDIIEAGLPEAKFHSFVCPMGLPIGTNHPQEIAISISAQLLQVRDKALVACAQAQKEKARAESHIKGA